MVEHCVFAKKMPLSLRAVSLNMTIASVEKEELHLLDVQRNVEGMQYVVHEPCCVYETLQANNSI